MFGGSWKAMQSARGAAGMVPFGKKHDFCPGKGENSGKLIPFLLGLFGYVLVHGDQKNPRIISHSSLLKPLGQLQRFHCPSLWKHLATPHSNMQKKLAVVTTQGDHHSWQPGVQHHWKWKIGECTIEQAVYSAYLLFTSIV